MGFYFSGAAQLAMVSGTGVAALVKSGFNTAGWTSVSESTNGKILTFRNPLNTFSVNFNSQDASQQNSPETFFFKMQVGSGTLSPNSMSYYHDFVKLNYLLITDNFVFVIGMYGGTSGIYGVSSYLGLLNPPDPSVNTVPVYWHGLLGTNISNQFSNAWISNAWSAATPVLEMVYGTISTNTATGLAPIKEVFIITSPEKRFVGRLKRIFYNATDADVYNSIDLKNGVNNVSIGSYLVLPYMFMLYNGKGANVVVPTTA